MLLCKVKNFDGSVKYEEIEKEKRLKWKIEIMKRGYGSYIRI